MKIIFAPDKFKGTLTALQVAKIESEAFLEIIPEMEPILLPLADGGEGTVETLTAAAKGTIRYANVHDPLGRSLRAAYGLSGKSAIIEMASASGMALLKPGELNPMKTSTFGTGELILSALDAGAEEIILGIGGSATIDGGCGMAEALGIRFYDRDGAELKNLCGAMLSAISRIDLEKRDPRLAGIHFRTASDVANPLLGPNGSAAVFGPQKGASPEMIPLLEKGLAHLRKIVLEQNLLSGDRAGDGAAGGLGFGLRAFCGSIPESGAQMAIRFSGLEQELSNANLLVTGEGCTDSQTENGKLCMELAKLCRRKNVPAILISGRAEENPGGLFMRIYSASESTELPFEEIRRTAAACLRKAALKAATDLHLPACADTNSRHHR